MVKDKSTQTFPLDLVLEAGRDLCRTELREKINDLHQPAETELVLPGQSKREMY